MHYCELTPRTNRGIVHVETILDLKNCKLEFNRESKLIKCTDINSGDSFDISPLYRYKLLEESKYHSKSCYKFEIGLKAHLPAFLVYKEQDLCDSKFLPEEAKKNSDKRLDDCISQDLCILEGFNKSEISCKNIRLSFAENIDWLEYNIRCRNLKIIEDSLLSIDINSVKGVNYLVFRIGIKVDSTLNYLNLKVNSISSESDIDLLKESNNILIRCKYCGSEVDSISNFYPISLPSDLYINSIGSIYCEECQDSLKNHKTSYEELELSKKSNILYLSDEGVVINRLQGDSCKNNQLHNDNVIISDKLNQENVEEYDVNCSKCKIIVGSINNNSISYYKNRVAGISGGFDIFWRHSEYIEFIEKIQFEEALKLKLSVCSEEIHIIKVNREPDTFIFVQNNPVLTTRILYKIEGKRPHELKGINSHIDEVTDLHVDIHKKNNIDIIDSGSIYANTNNTSCTLYPSGEQVDIRLYDHIKKLILLFSHDKINSTDYTPSLIPQI